MASSEEPPQLEADEKYHVFISCGSTDHEFSLNLLKRLEKIGYKCLYPERDFMPGVTIVSCIVEGIKDSQKVLLLVSKSFLKSFYMDFEVAEAMRKTLSKKQVTLIPLLIDVDIADVPNSIKAVNCIEQRKEGWFDRLTKGLNATSMVPDLVPSGDIGNGLAWSYYYGYLKLILPHLRDRAEGSEFAKSGIPFLKRFLAILPETSVCPSSFDKEDANIKTIGTVDFSVTISGNVGRNYKTAVHEVTDPRSEKKYLFMGEFCTPLRSIYEMMAGGIAGINEEGRKHQTLIFREKLKEILGHPKSADCTNFQLIPYRDVVVQSSSEVQEPQRLSVLLCDIIAYELEIEEQLRVMTATA